MYLKKITLTSAMNAGLLNNTQTKLTSIVIPSIILCMCEYLVGFVYDVKPCGEDMSLKSSHVSTSIRT